MKILNQSEYYVNNGGIDLLGILGVLATVVLIIVTLSLLLDGELGAFIVSFMLTAVIGFGTYHATDYATQTGIEYEVTIDDFNEVYEKGYEIVEKRGEIYVVRKAEESE